MAKTKHRNEAINEKCNTAAILISQRNANETMSIKEEQTEICGKLSWRRREIKLLKAKYVQREKRSPTN
jgi:hypothetical protein